MIGVGLHLVYGHVYQVPHLVIGGGRVSDDQRPHLGILGVEAVQRQGVGILDADPAAAEIRSFRQHLFQDSDHAGLLPAADILQAEIVYYVFFIHVALCCGVFGNRRVGGFPAAD